MEFAEAVRRRRMVRHYTGEPVDAQALERILDRARRAPSAGFTQGSTFVAITDAERRRTLARACGEDAYVGRGLPPWLSSAPVHVVVCVEPERYRERYGQADKAAAAHPDAWEVPFWWVDGGATLMLLLLAAVDEGLAAGFLAVPAERVRAVLGVPDEVALVGLVTIGHPAPDRRSSSLARGRRAWPDQVRWNGW